MQNNPQISIEALKELFVTTYQGSSTQSIHDAFGQLIFVSLNSYNHFLGLCETILETESKNKSLCLSVSNFVKVFTKKAVDEKLIDECGPKNFINRIEHMFDNNKILPIFKENIAISYIKAALHFRLNFEKIIEKILYLYNIKEYEQAVSLSRAYLSCENILDSKLKGLYYKKILPAEFKYLSEEVRSYKNRIQGENILNIKNELIELEKRIEDVLKNIQTALGSTPFEKFESSIFNCLKKDDIMQLIGAVDIFKPNKQIMISIRELMQKIIENLFRMHRIEKIPSLMKLISEILHEEWSNYQLVLKRGGSCNNSYCKNLSNEMDFEEELSIINFLTAGFNSHMIMIVDDNIDIWNLFIVPLYQMKVSIFNKNQEHHKEAFLIIEDATFTLKSETLEASFNKFIKEILGNYQSINSKALTEIDALLNSQLNAETIQDNQQKILMLLNFMTFQVLHFLVQDSFVYKVENFLKNNSEQLFNSSNNEIYFQSLLFLYHYLDDIFCDYLDTNIFDFIGQNFIQHKKDRKSLNSFEHSELDFMIEMEKLILSSYYSAGFSQKEIEKPSNILINYLSESFESDCLKVYINLIKNYQIDDKITLEILDKVIESISDLIFTKKINLESIHEELSAFVEFLITFFNLEVCKHLFESTLARVLSIFSYMVSDKNQFEDEFFFIIKNFTSHLEYVPENYLEWMGNIFNSSTMSNEEGFKSLAIVLEYLSPSKYSQDNFKYELFVNCVALNLIEILVTCKRSYIDENEKNALINEFKNSSNLSSFFSNEHSKVYEKKEICALLCLHQLIHFHSQHLTKKILSHIISFAATKIISQDQNKQNRNTCEDLHLEKGKYQLIFILLFKRRLFDTNEILIQNGLEKKVYDAVYMKENRYLIEYDTPLFIKEQIYIIRKLIQQDKIQMEYTNTSFLAVFHKFSMIFAIKKNKKGKGTFLDLESDDSDQEEFDIESELSKEYKEMARLVLSFPLPKEWINIDELSEIRQLIFELRSNETSREWLETLVNKCFSKDLKKIMDQLVSNLETVNGKYRNIIKVDRNKVTKDSTSLLNQEFEI